MYHSFKKFLCESEKQPSLSMKTEKPNVHLSHLEDMIFDHGHEGVERAADFLDDAHRYLTGHKAQNHYSVKYDGAPSIIFGHHPHTKEFFVATKAAFSRNPKLNFSKKDIQANHGSQLELANKLNLALTHLPKIMPKNAKSGETYQGDFLHDPSSVSMEGGFHTFKPNTIMYGAPRGSAHGANVKNSKMGIAVHTRYDTNGVAHPIDAKHREKFEKHPHVHNVDPSPDINPAHYTSEDIKEFMSHKNAATKLYRAMSPESLDAAMIHVRELHKHINDHVREGKRPTAETFIDHLHKGHGVRTSGISNEKWKKTVTSGHSEKLNHVMANADDINKSLQLHGHLQDAKNVLVRAMSKSSPWSHSIEGESSGPEGFVSVAPNGTAVKFVDRGQFSRANLNNQRFKKQDVHEYREESYLLTAIKHNNTIHKGWQGQDHRELAQEKNIPQDQHVEHGFVNHKGMFLNRYHAMEYAKERELLAHSGHGRWGDLTADMLK
jgi:hypothetical protein